MDWRHPLEPYLNPSFNAGSFKSCQRISSLSTIVGHRSTVKGRAFPVAGEKVWNGLPSDVTSASSLSGVQEQTEDILVPPLLRNWRWITFLFPSHYLPPQNSGPCNSFHCLGHSKNVYDDDDDELLPTGPAAGSSKPEAAGSLLWDHAGTDGWRDAQTPYGFKDPAVHTMWSVSIKYIQSISSLPCNAAISYTDTLLLHDFDNEFYFIFIISIMFCTPTSYTN